MKTVWRQGRATKDWFADYRGLSTRVRVDPETGKATTFPQAMNPVSTPLRAQCNSNPSARSIALFSSSTA